MQADKTKEIDGFKVRVTQHPARKATRLLAKVGRTIGPALGAMRGMKAADLKKDVADLAPLISTLFAQLTDEDVDSLVVDILSYTTVVDLEANIHHMSDAKQIDAVFTGELRTLMATLAFALEVNFRDFFFGNGNGSPFPQAAETENSNKQS